jgi:predicted nucleic acid-binding protein
LLRRVVSNTSPISNLAIIGRLDLLKRRYGVVRIPAAVAAELSVLRHPAAKTEITAALAEGWLVAQKTPPSSPQLPFPLDAGETEAIGLAQATQADVVLMDERRGREAARHHGLAVGGVLGGLLHARQSGVLPNLRSEINRLRSDAGFFVAAEIERFIPSQAGK